MLHFLFLSLSILHFSTALFCLVLIVISHVLFDFFLFKRLITAYIVCSCCFTRVCNQHSKSYLWFCRILLTGSLLCRRFWLIYGISFLGLIFSGDFCYTCCNNSGADI